jgi:predicted DNA-binding transcriptional regulator AlpA
MIQPVNIPPTMLGGTSEVAELLGCTKQQVYSLRRRSDFPPPVITLAATPIWDLREVRNFKLHWRRHKLTMAQAS